MSTERSAGMGMPALPQASSVRGCRFVSDGYGAPCLMASRDSHTMNSMNECQSRLLEFAKGRCLTHLMALPCFSAHLERLSFVVVGSVATGLCHEGSDIDIAVICDTSLYEVVSAGMTWGSGRPSEVEIEGRQVHYYATSLGEIDRGLRQLDDTYLYTYGNAVILRDPGHQFADCVAWVQKQAESVRRDRIEGKLDMLLRRSRALQQCLVAGDVLMIARVAIELVTRCAKLAGLLDDIQFDPRKQLLATALQGTLGRRLRNQIGDLLSSLGTLGEMKDRDNLTGWRFPALLDGVTESLCAEASRQGFRVGLARPDERQAGE